MFSKAEKKLHDNSVFNPPPGYYQEESAFHNKNGGQFIPSFSREDRFIGKHINNPGPGAYYNDRSDKIKRRIIDQNRKKEIQNQGSESEIKISSIPSIPKKSATRVYEELAPGILVLHEQENQNSIIGPGSYNVDSNLGYKKNIAYKINPEHKKKRPPPEPEIRIPTIAEEIRNQKRLMHQKKVIKSTGIKQMISPSDLCLEVIILREKLMRGDENPPPGLYYNEKYQSSFKEPDSDLLPEYQFMMGKADRFKYKEDQQTGEIGPGSYEPGNMKLKKSGVYLPKEQRKMFSGQKNIPGPGAYKLQSSHKSESVEAKGSYPPIFGTGANRFSSFQRKSWQAMPGPGSYSLENKRKKKPKLVKIKKQFAESQKLNYEAINEGKQELFSQGGDKSRNLEDTLQKSKKRESKNNHYFSSKVERFRENKLSASEVGPSNYHNEPKSFAKESFNKKKEYTGSKQERFDQNKIRPNVGPGSYLLK